MGSLLGSNLPYPIRSFSTQVYFTFYCKTQDDKQYWIAKIKKVIIDFHTGIGRRARDAHTLANRRRSSDVTTKPPIAPKPKVSAKPDSHEHHRRLFSRPGPRKRFSAADSLGMASMDHAPVSKKKEDDLVLNYNPYAQAGGFTGEKQEVGLGRVCCGCVALSRLDVTHVVALRLAASGVARCLLFTCRAMSHVDIVVSVVGVVAS